MVLILFRRREPANAAARSTSQRANIGYRYEDGIMSKVHPENGPSFSKATIKKTRPPATSPGRKQAELEQTARDTAKARKFNKDSAGWMREHLLKKK